ncbi:MAG: FecR domain-containing protein [Acidobacteriota bacterium]
MKPWWIAGGVAIAAAAGTAIAVMAPRGRAGPAVERTPETGFDFIARDGAVLVDGRAMSVGTLAPGGVLDSRASRVELLIANLGRAELEPATRVRLVRSDASARQLAIERGKLYVRVSVAPHLFVVSAPAATVTGGGCAYVLEVDATGGGRVAVQSGRVELAAKSRAVLVPAGAHAQLAAGSLPGLPIADGARSELEDAAARYAAGGPAEPLLAAATARDAVTLAALAGVDTAARPAALARLAALAPPPDGVTVAGAMKDPAQLARWRDAVVPGAPKKTP